MFQYSLHPEFVTSRVRSANLKANVLGLNSPKGWSSKNYSPDLRFTLSLDIGLLIKAVLFCHHLTKI